MYLRRQPAGPWLLLPDGRCGCTEKVSEVGAA